MDKINKEIAQSLLNENKSGISWREMSRRFENVKPGTLCRIAKSGGKYFPKQLRVKSYRRLDDLSPKELLYVLNHRVNVV